MGAYTATAEPTAEDPSATPSVTESTESPSPEVEPVEEPTQSASPQSAEPQVEPVDDSLWPRLMPAETDRYLIDKTDGDTTVSGATPDLAYTNGAGGRVEVYSSVGNLDGSDSMDWRPLTVFSYLVKSVPKGSPFYATVYNSFWDGFKPNKTSDGKWTFSHNPYAPTQAFLYQLNQYDTDAERQQYIHTLGNKLTFNDAVKNNSSLALLLKGAGVIKTCAVGDGACFATTNDGSPLMHSKYALFSKTKDSQGKEWENVVWITSSNLNAQSGSKKTNLSIALYGDKDAYEGLLQGVWNPTIELADKGKANTNRDFSKFDANYLKAATEGVQATDDDFVFYPSPRKVDLEEKFLIESTNAKLGITKENCKAYLVHSLFSSARKGVTDDLAALKKDGCDVRLLLGSGSMANLVDSYFSMGTELREIIDRVEFANVHDKTLLVSYQQNGVEKGGLWVGSANLNGTSLYFDELVTKVTNSAVVSAAVLQFDRLYQLARSGSITPVTKVTVSPTNHTLAPGGTVTLKATVSALPEKLTPNVPTVYWRSSNNEIATVASNGTVTAKTAGSSCETPLNAQITATSLSGVKTGSTTISVVPDGCEVSAEVSPSGVGSLEVVAAPAVSIKRYESPSVKRQVVVTWAQADLDLSGKVQLQYLNGAGTWVNSSAITVKNGRGTLAKNFTGSNYWRVKTVSLTTSNAKLSATLYSSRVPVVSRNKAAQKTSVRLYATPAVYKGSRALFLMQWKNPYDSSRQTRLILQYHNGKKWLDYKGDVPSYYVISKGDTLVQASAPIDKTRKWRFKTSTVAQPKGKKVLYSNSITIRAKK